MNAALMSRTARIVALGEAAAASDAEIAGYRDRAHESARDDVRALAAALRRVGSLAPDVDERHAADTIFALAGDEGVYLRLTRECGWTDAQYAELIGRSLQAVLGTPATPTARPGDGEGPSGPGAA
jgi:hypothetical protein